MIDKVAARPIAVPTPVRSPVATPISAPAPAATAAKTGWVAKAKPSLFQRLGHKIHDTLQSGVAKAGLTAYAPLQAPPTLKRPVVMIPGLTLNASSYDPLARHLSSNKANGPVATFVAADGKFHLGGKDGRVMAQGEVTKANIFEMEY